MNTPENKKPAVRAGNEASGKSWYNNNIYQNLYSVNPKIAQKAQGLQHKWNMGAETFEQAAIVWARMFWDAAPLSVRERLSGKPSLLPSEAKSLAVAFFVVYNEALDRTLAMGMNEPVDAAECWEATLKIMGVAL